MMHSPESNGKADSADSPLSAALAYAARGWHVIPLHHVEGAACSCRKGAECGSIAKHPRTKNGSKDATSDAAQIRRWWKGWPAAGVGICTGQAEGLFMVGPDGPAGLQALAELEKRGSQLPRTPTARSGSGGKHFYFRWPAGPAIMNDRNHLGLPIDIRGEGGYAVAPPSSNAKGAYAWEVSPSDAEAAEAPAWLLEWCRAEKPERASSSSNGTAGGNAAAVPASIFHQRATGRPSIADRAIAYLAEVPPAIADQGGHDQTLWAARVVVLGFDLGPDFGYSILATHYNPRCVPPWSDKELRHKCEQAASVPFGKPRGWLLDEERQGSGEGQARRLGKDVILEHFRKTYRPAFRRGELIYTHDGRELKRTEACFGASDALLEALKRAIDVPKDDEDKPRLAAMPAFFKKWAPTAWANLLAGLGEEGTDAEIIEPAEEEFQAQVAAVLHRIVSIGYVKDKDTHVEQRSLLDWCVLFAKTGRWARVRSFLLWCRLASEAGPLCVALRVGLFGQVPSGPLAKIGQRLFARRAEMYGIGQECRAGGSRAVELTQAFLAELLASPDLTEGPALAHARENDLFASTLEESADGAST
jgi:hypothetical protein